MVDQLSLQTIGIVIAAISVVIGVLNSILVSRRDERRQNLLLKNQELATETRQAQLFMQLYDKSMSKEMTDASRTFYGLKFESYEEYKNYFLTQREFSDHFEAWKYLANFYEGLGLLVMEGLVSIRMVTVFMDSAILGFYNKFGGEYLQKFREETGRFGTLSETEYLYNRMMKFIEENPDFRDYKIP
jgi:hypothetical protein